MRLIKCSAVTLLGTYIPSHIKVVSRIEIVLLMLPGFKKVLFMFVLPFIRAWFHFRY